MSAVLRISVEGEPLALLPGDLDVAGLGRLVETDADLRAPILVFPHHGGMPGGSSPDPVLRDFARVLAERVQPETVVFSLARLRFQNPQPAIIEGVRAAAPDVRIACTQLSRRCSEDLLASDAHLAARFSAGRIRGLCCAGTMVLSSEGTWNPSRDDHQSAIIALEDRLCR